MILFLRDRMNRTGRPVFSRAELSRILSVYGDRVKRGEWRDYAIDSLADMAVFSVFRSTHEAPIYTIAKIPGRSILKSPQYVVSAGRETLKEGPSLDSVLAVFEGRA